MGNNQVGREAYILEHEYTKLRIKMNMVIVAVLELIK